MYCRICMEGPGGIENPLRVRCNCKNCAFHDSCLIKWIIQLHKNAMSNRSREYNDEILPNCEVCRSSFKGIKLHTRRIHISPGHCIAQIVGVGHWILLFFFLHYYGFDAQTFNQCEKIQKYNEHHFNKTEIQQCSSVIFMLNLYLYIVNMWVAFLWARRCYKNQLRKYPCRQGIKINMRQLILSPGPLCGVKQRNTLYNEESKKNYIKLVKDLWAFTQHYVSTAYNRSNNNDMNV